jgi:hypothetical protein
MLLYNTFPKTQNEKKGDKKIFTYLSFAAGEIIDKRGEKSIKYIGKKRLDRG